LKVYASYLVGNKRGGGTRKNMGKVTNHGWVNSSDEIPQPTSILLGRNLRKNPNEISKKETEEPKEKEPPPEK
jgi:hypothetical protein